MFRVLVKIYVNYYTVRPFKLVYLSLKDSIDTPILLLDIFTITANTRS